MPFNGFIWKHYDARMRGSLNSSPTEGVRRARRRVRLAAALQKQQQDEFGEILRQEIDARNRSIASLLSQRDAQREKDCILAERRRLRQQHARQEEREALKAQGINATSKLVERNIKKSQRMREARFRKALQQKKHEIARFEKHYTDSDRKMREKHLQLQRERREHAKAVSRAASEAKNEARLTQSVRQAILPFDFYPKQVCVVPSRAMGTGRERSHAFAEAMRKMEKHRQQRTLAKGQLEVGDTKPTTITARDSTLKVDENDAVLQKEEPEQTPSLIQAAEVAPTLRSVPAVRQVPIPQKKQKSGKRVVCSKEVAPPSFTPSVKTIRFVDVDSTTRRKVVVRLTNTSLTTNSIRFKGMRRQSGCNDGTKHLEVLCPPSGRIAAGKSTSLAVKFKYRGTEPLEDCAAVLVFTTHIGKDVTIPVEIVCKRLSVAVHDEGSLPSSELTLDFGRVMIGSETTLNFVLSSKGALPGRVDTWDLRSQTNQDKSTRSSSVASRHTEKEEANSQESAQRSDAAVADENDNPGNTGDEKSRTSRESELEVKPQPGFAFRCETQSGVVLSVLPQRPRDSDMASTLRVQESIGMQCLLQVPATVRFDDCSGFDLCEQISLNLKHKEHVADVKLHITARVLPSPVTADTTNIDFGRVLPCRVYRACLKLRNTSNSAKQFRIVRHRFSDSINEKKHTDGIGDAPPCEINGYDGDASTTTSKSTAESKEGLSKSNDNKEDSEDDVPRSDKESTASKSGREDEMTKNDAPASDEPNSSVSSKVLPSERTSRSPSPPRERKLAPASFQFSPRVSVVQANSDLKVRVMLRVRDVEFSANECREFNRQFFVLVDSQAVPIELHAHCIIGPDELCFEPKELDLGQCIVGEAVAATVQVTNKSKAHVAKVVSTRLPTGFILPIETTAILPGASETLKVVFAPNFVTEKGREVADLEFMSNLRAARVCDNKPFLLPVRATAVEPPLQVALSAGCINFNAVVPRRNGFVCSKFQVHNRDCQKVRVHLSAPKEVPVALEPSTFELEPMSSREVKVSLHTESTFCEWLGSLENMADDCTVRKVGDVFEFSCAVSCSIEEMRSSPFDILVSGKQSLAKFERRLKVEAAVRSKDDTAHFYVENELTVDFGDCVLGGTSESQLQLCVRNVDDEFTCHVEKEEDSPFDVAAHTLHLPEGATPLQLTFHPAQHGRFREEIVLHGPDTDGAFSSDRVRVVLCGNCVNSKAIVVQDSENEATTAEDVGSVCIAPCDAKPYVLHSATIRNIGTDPLRAQGAVLVPRSPELTSIAAKVLRFDPSPVIVDTTDGECQVQLTALCDVSIEEFEAAFCNLEDEVVAREFTALCCLNSGGQLYECRRLHDINEVHALCTQNNVPCVRVNCVLARQPVLLVPTAGNAYRNYINVTIPGEESQCTFSLRAAKSVHDAVDCTMQMQVTDDDERVPAGVTLSESRVALQCGGQVRTVAITIDRTELQNNNFVVLVLADSITLTVRVHVSEKLD